MKICEILQQSYKDIALVIGNGINRYRTIKGGNSWDELLGDLARIYLDPLHLEIPRGVSLTEFYDILELAALRINNNENIQQQFCELMAYWQYQEQHKYIAEWASYYNVPILTTNFEGTIGQSVNCELHRIGLTGFTRFYPWDSYYGLQNLQSPCDGFAVWHINGMQHYQHSVRLGLTHYMGSVQRARQWIHNEPNRLVAGINDNTWRGASTWLQIFFQKPLLIFGLGLNEDEVFLRWLLVERAKYFYAFPEKLKKAWYVYSGNENNGKLLFLNAVGVTPVAVPDYDAIYGSDNWTIPSSR